MSRLQSILAAILVVFATFLFSFSSFAASAKAATYTPAQIERIQKYVTPITELRDRLTTELPSSIKQRDWVDVKAFIHGPLGTLRQDLALLSRNLLPKDQAAARQAAKNVFGHLEAIDKAADAANYEQAVTNYREALKDLDAFWNLVPQG